MSITLQGAGDEPGSLRHLGKRKYAYRPTRSKRDGENPVQMEEIITVKGSCWKEPCNRALLEQPGNDICLQMQERPNLASVDNRLYVRPQGKEIFLKRQ